MLTLKHATNKCNNQTINAIEIERNGILTCRAYLPIRRVPFSTITLSTKTKQKNPGPCTLVSCVELDLDLPLVCGAHCVLSCQLWTMYTITVCYHCILSISCAHCILSIMSTVNNSSYTLGRRPSSAVQRILLPTSSSSSILLPTIK